MVDVFFDIAQVMPIVRFQNGIERVIGPEIFEMVVNEVGACSRAQVMNAWKGYGVGLFSRSSGWDTGMKVDFWVYVWPKFSYN